MKKQLFITLVALAALVAVLSSVGSMSYGTEFAKPFYSVCGLLNLFVWAAGILYFAVRRDKKELDNK